MTFTRFRVSYTIPITYARPNSNPCFIFHAANAGDAQGAMKPVAIRFAYLAIVALIVSYGQVCTGGPLASHSLLCFSLIIMKDIRALRGIGRNWAVKTHNAPRSTLPSPLVV